MTRKWLDYRLKKHIFNNNDNIIILNYPLPLVMGLFRDNETNKFKEKITLLRIPTGRR